MKLFFLPFLLLLPSLLFSQYYELDSLPPAKKNAVGVVITPVVIAALAAGTGDHRYGLQYRRLLSDNKRLRISGNYQWMKDVELYGYPVAMSDSSITEEHATNGYNYGELRVGLEWGNFRQKYDAIYGVDIIAGYDKTFSKQSRTERRPEGSPATTNIYGSAIRDSIVSHYTDHSLVFGIAPTFGYRVNIKDDLELMANMSLEFVYYSALKTETFDVPVMHSHSSTFLFRMRLLDLVLSYRF